MQVPEIDSTAVYSLVEHNTDLYAATPNLIYKSTDNGVTWHATVSQPNLTSEINKLYSYESTIYVATLKDGVLRSDNGGHSWENMSTGLPVGWGASIVGLVVLGDSLYAGTDGNGVYVFSLQNPSVWSSFNNGLFQYGVNYLGTSGNNLIAGVALYLFVRPRSSFQWTDVYMDSIGVQREVYKTLHLDQDLFAGTDRGVYRGTVDAQYWKTVDIRAFPKAAIVALAAHGSRLIAGLNYRGQYWIFSTEDAGITWDFRAHEFAMLSELFVSGDRLWACRTDGLWYLDINSWTGIDDAESDVPSRFYLSQNYPNPFNASTKILFTLPKAAHTEIKLYNILGREILTLLSEFKNAGTHALDLDAGSIGSGVYAYKLLAGQYVDAKKMIVVK